MMEANEWTLPLAVQCASYHMDASEASDDTREVRGCNDPRASQTSSEGHNQWGALQGLPPMASTLDGRGEAPPGTQCTTDVRCNESQFAKPLLRLTDENGYAKRIGATASSIIYDVVVYYGAMLVLMYMMIEWAVKIWWRAVGKHATRIPLFARRTLTVFARTLLRPVLIMSEVLQLQVCRFRVCTCCRANCSAVVFYRRLAVDARTHDAVPITSI